MGIKKYETWTEKRFQDKLRSAFNRCDLDARDFTQLEYALVIATMHIRSSWTALKDDIVLYKAIIEKV